MKFEILGYTIIMQKTAEANKSINNATNTRVQKAKQKIIKGVAELRAEGKNITQYAVWKKTNVSVNTIRKYKELLLEK